MPSLTVKSVDLKFGIDRILAQNTQSSWTSSKNDSDFLWKRLYNGADNTEINFRSKRLKSRTIFELWQVVELERVFDNLTHYPPIQMREELAERLRIEQSRIQVWFQNRRAKWRRLKREQQQEGMLIPGHSADVLKEPAPMMSVLLPIIMDSQRFAECRYSVSSTPICLQIPPSSVQNPP